MLPYGAPVCSGCMRTGVYVLCVVRDVFNESPACGHLVLSLVCGADRFSPTGMYAWAALSGLRDSFKENVVVFSISCVVMATLSCLHGAACLHTTSADLQAFNYVQDGRKGESVHCWRGIHYQPCWV